MQVSCQTWPGVLAQPGGRAAHLLADCPDTPQGNKTTQVEHSAPFWQMAQSSEAVILGMLSLLLLFQRQKDHFTTISKQAVFIHVPP